MKNKLKIRIILPVLVVASVLFIACNKQQKIAVHPKPLAGPTFVSVDNGRMSFHIIIQYADQTNSKLCEAIQKANPLIMFLALIDSDRSMISAAKYSDTLKVTIKEAFNITVHSVTSFDNESLNSDYKLIDSGTYTLHNKTLRFKVLAVNDNIISTMYYFMKDDYDYDLYELKAVSTRKLMKEIKCLTESIALTVEIK